MNPRPSSNPLAAKHRISTILFPLFFSYMMGCFSTLHTVTKLGDLREKDHLCSWLHQYISRAFNLLAGGIKL